jgi:hypothetical protein
VIQGLTADGELPRMCRGRVRQFAARSTCGRDDVVACCIKTARGPWRPLLRRRDAGCVPPLGGASCPAAFPHLEDACLRDGGCRAAVCGNDIIEPGEFCDGEAFCAGCQLAVKGCCELSVPEDGSTFCLETSVAGANACVNAAQGRFSIGTACEGEPCGTVQGCYLSPCVDTPIEPVSVCCQMDAGGCTDAVVDSTGELASAVIFECTASGTATAVLGTCGGDGRCVAAR